MNLNLTDTELEHLIALLGDHQVGTMNRLESACKRQARKLDAIKARPVDPALAQDELNEATDHCNRLRDTARTNLGILTKIAMEGITQ